MAMTDTEIEAAAARVAAAAEDAHSELVLDWLLPEPVLQAIRAAARREIDDATDRALEDAGL